VILNICGINESEIAFRNNKKRVREDGEDERRVLEPLT